MNLYEFSQKQVYSIKPFSIGSLVECVEEFAEGYSENTIRNVCNTVLKRARLCLQAGGGQWAFHYSKGGHYLWAIASNIIYGTKT